MPRPMFAALRSLALPGWGQLYDGQRAKGLAVLCVDAGIGLSLALSLAGAAALRSWLAAGMLGIAYLAIWIPSIMDAYEDAAGDAQLMPARGRVTERAWYIVTMLLVVGPAAIPLLWSSRRFSRRAKILLTSATLLLAVAAVLSIVVLGPILERWTVELRQSLEPFP